jgi:hypothetical protein
LPRLTLSFVSAYNERVQPLMDGTVQPEGLELIPTYSHPSETFWRQLKFGEFEWFRNMISQTRHSLASCRRRRDGRRARPRDCFDRSAWSS